MDREIRYCTTPDGARIAYTTNGSGEPLLCTSGFLPFAFREEEPRWRSLDHHLEQRFTVTRYDGRGFRVRETLGFSFLPPVVFRLGLSIAIELLLRTRHGHEDDCIGSAGEDANRDRKDRDG